MGIGLQSARKKLKIGLKGAVALQSVIINWITSLDYKLRKD